MLRPTILGLALLGALSQGGCGAHEAPARRPNGDAGSALPPAAEVGARWAFHPEKASAATARLELSPGRFLEVDRAGTRWLVEGAEVRPSVLGAPEGLVAVAKQAGGFAVVGESGTVYLADEPLGALHASRPPPIPLVRTSASGSTLLGASAGGQLLRSDDLGLRWHEVPVPGFVEHVQLAESGAALVVTLPERWFSAAPGRSELEERRWPSLGPLELSRRSGGAVRVRGLLGEFVWNAQDRLEPAPRSDEPTAPRRLLRFIDAESLEAGRAAWDGQGIVGLESSREGQPPDRWLRGGFARPLELTATAEFTNCGSYRVAASGAHVHVLCADRRRLGVAPQLHLWSSADGGVSFNERHVPLRGQAELLTLAAHGSGGVALSGVCPAVLSAEGCQARGVHFLAAGSKKLAPLPFAGIEVARRLGFSGGALWALGRRAKDQHLLLESVVGLVPTAKAKQEQSRLDVWFDVESRSGLPLEGGSERMALFPSETALGVAFQARGAWQVVAVSTSGELLGYGRAPAGVTSLAGVGSKLLAIDKQAMLAWESQSGGLDWQSSALPRAPCDATARNCGPAVVCVEPGCWVGAELLRSGWGQDAAPGQLASSSRDAGPNGARPVAAVAHCRLDGADYEEMSPFAWPSAADAALGDAAFAQLEFDPRHAAAQALRARYGQKKLEREVLLAPLADGEHFATAASPQIEGSAVLRYRMTKSASLRAGLVEVAWDNRISNVTGHGQLANVPTLAGEDLSNWNGQYVRARPSLFSVAGPGLYLSFHGKPGSVPVTHYFEGDRVRAVVNPAWPESVRQGEFEFVRLGDRDVPLAWFGEGRVVVSQRQGPPRDFIPLLLLPERARSFAAQGVGVAYAGQEVGIFSWIAELQGSFGRASVVPVLPSGEFGTPLPVPLLGDVPRAPRACSEQERKTTPRIVAPAQGFRHEILVEDAQGTTIVLSTERAVLHGTPQAPCVAAFEAEQREGTTGRQARYRALWFPGQNQVSWLFREQLDAAPPRSARPLSCSDSTERPPPAARGSVP